MGTPIRILHLDDNPSDAQLVAMTLEIEQEKFPTTLHYVQTKEEYLAALRRKDFDLILSDYRMPGYDGDQALAAARETCPEIPFIMVTGELGEELVIETLKRGATDYVIKDRIFRLVPAIKRALVEVEYAKKAANAEAARERLVEELGKRQGELLAVIQAMEGGVTVVDAKGDIILVNEAEVKMLGYNELSDLKHNFSQFINTYEFKDADGTVLPVENWPLVRIMRGETVVNCELRGRRKDTGREWFFSFSGQPVRDGSGKQILSVLVARDITQRRLSEEELRKAEHATAEILESVQDPFYGLDSQWRFTYVNTKAEEFMEMRREGLLGRSLWEVFPQTTGTASERILRAVMESRRPLHQEFRSVLTGVWVEVHVFPKADGGLTVLYRDISGRKANEEALRLSEERFAATFRASPYPLALSRVSDGKFFDVNDALLALYGATREEVLGTTSLELGIWPDPKERNRYIELLKREGNLHDFETRIGTRIHGERVVLLSVSLLQVGKEQSMLTIVNDVTERKQAETLLLASEEKFRQLVETANEGISVADTEGHLSFVNERFSTLLGYSSPEELIGRSVFDLVVDKEAAHENLKRRLEGEKSNYEFAYLRKDGSLLWALVSATPLSDKDGKVVGTFGMVTDITERKQMEAALRESDERFRTLADNIPQLAWMTDEAGWIFWYNKRWFDYTGTTLHEMEGWGWQKVHHPEHLERVTEKFRRALVVGQSWEDTFPLKSKTGEYRWFLSRAFPIRNAEGQITRWFGTNTDITDLKKAEEAVLEAALFPEENTSPVMRVSHAGILLYANRASKPVLEQLSFIVGDIVPKSLAEPVRTALRKGTSSTVDFKFQDSVFSFLVAPVQERQYANLYGRDVTEQRQMEERLKESEELSRLALDAGRAGAWSWDMKTGTLQWSYEFYRIFGIEPGTIEPRAEEGLLRIHPEDRSHVTALIEKSLATGEAIDETHRVVWPDGSVHWIRGMAKAFFDAPSESKPKRLVGLAIDVTAQKEIEQQLEKRNRELDAERFKWQQLIEGIADEVWACDVEGRVSMVNFNPKPGTESIEFKGDELSKLLQDIEVLRPDGSVRPLEESPLQRSLKGEVVRGEETVLSRTTREIRIRQHSSVPVRDVEGVIIGAAAIVRDITEARAAEAEIRRLNEELEERVTLRTAALERANKELEAFSYSVSHDLKAPLRLISGFADLIASQGGTNLTAKQQEFLATIQTQSAHMDELIRVLLEFSRITRKDPKLVLVDTRQMAKEVVAEQRQFAGNEAAKTVLVEIGDLPVVQADPVLLRMVFTNLLSNAFKFTRTVAEPRITIEATAENGFFQFRVADNGVGFPRGQTEKLFKVFQRLHAAREFEGSGIGLANVRKIIERHGGQVCGDGDEGKGATFYFSLPDRLQPSDGSQHVISTLSV